MGIVFKFHFLFSCGAKFFGISISLSISCGNSQRISLLFHFAVKAFHVEPCTSVLYWNIDLHFKLVWFWNVLPYCTVLYTVHHLVILARSDQEHHQQDILETVNPEEREEEEKEIPLHIYITLHTFTLHYILDIPCVTYSTYMSSHYITSHAIPLHLNPIKSKSNSCSSVKTFVNFCLFIQIHLFCICASTNCSTQPQPKPSRTKPSWAEKF